MVGLTVVADLDLAGLTRIRQRFAPLCRTTWSALAHCPAERSCWPRVWPMS